MSDNTRDPNYLFNVKTGKGEPAVRILLSKKPEGSTTADESDDTPAPRKGVLHGRRRPNAPLIRKKKGSVLNFYDMGQVKNEEGDWVDLPYESALDFAPTLDLSLAHIVSVCEADRLFALRDLLLPDPETWKTKFRKVELDDAVKYGLAVQDASNSFHYVAKTGESVLDSGTISSSEWSSAGLKLKTTFKALRPGAAFEAFALDSSFYKITTAPDFTADPASFTPAKVMDVFCVPSVINLSSFKSVTQSDDPTRSDNLHLYYGAYIILSRQFWLDRTDGAFTGSIFAQGFADATGLPVTFTSTFTLVDGTNISDVLGQFNASGGRIFVLSTGDGGIEAIEAVESWPPVVPMGESGSSTLAYYRTTTLADTFLDFSAPVANNIIGDIDVPYVGSGDTPDTVKPIAGQLVGAIQQNGTTYYFWVKDGLNYTDLLAVYGNNGFRFTNLD